MATNRYILQTLMFFLIIPNCIGAGELTKGKMIGNWLSAEMSTGSLVSSTSEKSIGVNFNIAFYSEKNCMLWSITPKRLFHLMTLKR